MTRKSFYRTFRKVAKLYNWTLYDDSIREMDGENFYPVCPINAVYRVRAKVDQVPSFEAWENGPKIGLSEADTDLIARASDYPYDELSPKERYARKALLRAVNLAP